MKNLLCFLLLLAAACGGHNKSQDKPSADSLIVVLNIKADLGEGAIWNQQENLLWWIDIEKGILHKFNPADGTDKEYPMGRRIGTVVPAVSGKAIVALEDGLNFFDPATGDLSFIADPDAGIPEMRYNDGKCDPSGRLWVGGMGTGENNRYQSSLYRLDHDLKTYRMLDSITCSNGICWSLDRTKMYYIDTPTMKVMVFDYDDNTGEIKNGRTLVEVPQGMGAPDGMTIDSDGNLWVCMWGGANVTCFDGETGALLRKIEVPAANVTSCAFGGKDLKTLYITTAGLYMSPEAAAKYTQAGNLFAIDLDVKGVPAFFF